MKNLLIAIALLITFNLSAQTVDTVVYSFYPNGTTTDWRFIIPSVGESLRGCRVKDFYYLGATPEKPALGVCSILYDYSTYTSDTVSLNVYNIRDLLEPPYPPCPYPLTRYGRANPLISVECLIYHP